jgi:hypothetical protein
MRARLLLGLALVLALGCGSGKFASVSGKVTLNDKPLANATVSFQPIAAAGERDAGGAGSTGKTNANGEYTLKTTTGQDGAWVGEHRVLISSLSTEAGGEDRRGGPKLKETVPTKYNSETTLKFTVKPGGTREADFKLTSP